MVGDNDGVHSLLVEEWAFGEEVKWVPENGAADTEVGFWRI